MVETCFGRLVPLSPRDVASFRADGHLPDQKKKKKTRKVGKTKKKERKKTESE